MTFNHKAIPEKVTSDNGTKDPSTKLFRLKVLVEEALELNTTGKLFELNKNKFFLFKLFLKMHNWSNCSFQVLCYEFV